MYWNRLQELSVDYTKAAEALRTWGKHEKDDLGVRSLLAVDELSFNVFLAIGHSYCFNNPSQSFLFGPVAIRSTRRYHATPTRNDVNEGGFSG